MRRPPILTFVTYNRLGNTIPSLTSLLESTDDFELYLLDNFSQDNTWEYLNSVNDPRIIKRVRSDKNIMLGLINQVLLNRKPDQDWLNFEYDTLLKTKNFISIFNEIFEADANIASLSGSFKEWNTGEINVFDNPSLFSTINNHKLYLSMTMGFCSFIRYEIMNQLGYVDEVSFGMDQDINGRIYYNLKKHSGYVFDVLVAMIGVPPCDECRKFQNICKEDNLCIKYYKKFHDIMGDVIPFQKVIHENCVTNRTFCDTIFNPKCSLTEEQKEIANKNYNFFSNGYQENIDRINKIS